MIRVFTKDLRMDSPSAGELICYSAIINPDKSIFLKVRSEYVRGILR